MNDVLMLVPYRATKAYKVTIFISKSNPGFLSFSLNKG